MKADDIKLFSAVFVAVAPSVPVLIQKWKMKRSYVWRGTSKRWN